MIELNTFKKILEENEERLPLLTLDELVLAGDTIVICTTILPAELEKLVNCEWLCSDGVITIEAFELNTYSCVPPIPDNFDCLEIVWD